MKLNKILMIKLLMFLIFPLFFLGTVDLYQTGTIKNDGSGTMRVQYSAKESFLKPRKYTVGNLSFNEEIAKKTFESPNTTVKLAKLNYDVNDSTYYMTVDVEFKDINALAETPGFSNVVANIEPTDSGNVFKYILSKDPELYKDFGSLTFIFDFESPVLSSNGGMEGNKVTWRSLGSKNSDPSSDVVFLANIKSDGSNNSSNKSSGKEKSCGLFGLELPFLLLGGLALFLRAKTKAR